MTKKEPQIIRCKKDIKGHLFKNFITHIKIKLFAQDYIASYDQIKDWHSV